MSDTLPITVDEYPGSNIFVVKWRGQRIGIGWRLGNNRGDIVFMPDGSSAFADALNPNEMYELIIARIPNVKP